MILHVLAKTYFPVFILQLFWKNTVNAYILNRSTCQMANEMGGPLYILTYSPAYLSNITLHNKQKHYKNMKCNVQLMIDYDVAEKKNENKVGMPSY